MVGKKQKLMIYEETKELVELFLETGMSDIDLSKKTGISSSTVGRRLTNHEAITYVFTEESKISGIENNTNEPYGEFIYNLVKQKRHLNQKMARSKGGKTSIEKYGYFKDKEGKYINVDKIDLSKLYYTKDSRDKFLTLLMLSFRLKFETIKNNFVGVDDEFASVLDEKYKRAFDFLNECDNANQLNAIKKCKEFYLEVYKSLEEENENKFRELLKEVNDYHFLMGIRKKEIDYVHAIKYQIKYAYSIHEMADILGISVNEYLDNVKKYLGNNKELQESYLKLLNFIKLEQKRGM